MKYIIWIYILARDSTYKILTHWFNPDLSSRDQKPFMKGNSFFAMHKYAIFHVLSHNW